MTPDQTLTPDQPDQRVTKDGDRAATTEVREDPFTGAQVVLAVGRADRPAAFSATPAERQPAAAGARRSCPFCRGHEDETPPEVWADRPDGSRPDQPGWQIRVVPNKYPAFVPTQAPGGGWHEVVIHGPDHHTSLGDLPAATLIRVVAAWRRRLTMLRSQELLTRNDSAVLVVVNQGRRAGATLEHSHSQVYATSFRPKLVAAEVLRLSGAGCAACAVTATQGGGGPRRVAESGGLLTVCPWASAAPLETLILPLEHHAAVEDGGPTVDHDLAAAIADVLGRTRAALGWEPPLNLVLHTAPPGIGDFHWHLHLIPRLTTPAAFELGTGVSINVLDPDRAAAQLRAAAEQ